MMQKNSAVAIFGLSFNLLFCTRNGCLLPAYICSSQPYFFIVTKDTAELLNNKNVSAVLAELPFLIA